ncbi:MAG: hypothetical protein J1F39_01235 [Clostridiales bacterium]|nr:hypothetical protein [Clostridiales bacterium]
MSNVKNEIEPSKGVNESLTEVKGYKFYAALKYVPVILYGIFFLFAVAVLIVTFVSSISTAHSADAFKGYEGVPVVYCIALTIGTGFAVLAIISCVRGAFGRRKSTDSLGATFAGNVNSAFFLIYVIYAILAIFMLTASFKESSIVTYGTLSVIFLSVILLFTIASVVCQIVRVQMEKHNEFLRETEQLKHEKK